MEASWHSCQEWPIVITAIIFAAVLATFYAGHNVADHVFGQNDHQAANKAAPGLTGYAALMGHVFRYHVVVVSMLLIAIAALDLPVTPLGLIVGIVFSAVSHAFLDRRWPVRWILEHSGSPGFAQMTTPLHGMYLADQGLHYACLWISALLVACL